MSQQDDDAVTRPRAAAEGLPDERGAYTPHLPLRDHANRPGARAPTSPPSVRIMASLNMM
jgi:hypothetical protein